MSPLYVLPDTNTLMHFTRPDQLDWSKYVKGRQVVIVLPAVTAREIDKHANQHPVRRLKDRARGLKGWIRGLIGPEASPNARVVVDPREPAAHFAEGLDPGVPDDRLIAAALMLRAEGKEVAVFSDDTLLQAKLPAHGVAGLWPDNGERLKDEPDPLEAENEKLRRELAQFAVRRPALAVEWEDGEPVLEIAVTPPDLSGVPSPDDIRRDLPPLPDPGPRPEAAARDLATLGQSWPSRERVEAYNAALETYYAEYEAYYAKLAPHAARVAHIGRLQFVAHNRGTAAATHFRAQIELPDGLLLLDDEGVGKPPVAPRPPRKPGDMSISLLFGEARSATAMPRLLGLHRNWDDSPYLDVEAGIVRLQRDKLLHHHSFTFEPAIVLVDSTRLGGGAQLEVEITAEELPHPISNKLAIRIVRYP